MSDKQRFPLQLAELVATSLISDLAEACQRIHVAGSIRRRRQDVGDIELLCVPQAGPPNIFGEPTPTCTLTDSVSEATRQLMGRKILTLRKSAEGKTAFGGHNKLMVHVATGIPVDIFSTPRENWGMALLVRTGPAEYCQQVMSRFIQLGMNGHAYGGVTDRRGQEVACPEEEDVYRLLEWNWKEPALRGLQGDERWAGVRAQVETRTP